MLYLLKMRNMEEASKIQKVLNSLKFITEKYITYHFSNYLFDNGCLNFDWAGSEDPDLLEENKLPAAKISLEKLDESINDFWVHNARFYVFYLYQNLDLHVKNNLAIIDYINYHSKQDIINAITCLCVTGRIYQTQYIQPEEVIIFTGSSNKTLAEHYADLDLIAIQKLDNKLFFEYIKKMTI